MEGLVLDDVAAPRQHPLRQYRLRRARQRLLRPELHQQLCGARSVEVVGAHVHRVEQSNVTQRLHKSQVSRRGGRRGEMMGMKTNEGFLQVRATS